MKKRLFVDMDGTLAHFQNVEKIETLYEQGYYLSLPPHPNLIKAIHQMNSNPEIDVYILSAVLENSLYAEKEKKAWINKFLPEIKPDHIIFTPCGKPKCDYIPNLSKSDTLLDDYTVNLNEWVKKGGNGIKFINRINGKHGRWQGTKIFHYANPTTITKMIESIIAALPEPVDVKTSEHIPRRPVIFQCPYINSDDKKQHKVFIAAYDKLDAIVLFKLHMKNTNSLLEDMIESCPSSKLTTQSHCLNFENPVKDNQIR